MKTSNAALREKIAELSPDQKEQLEQYAQSIKEIKKEINNLLNKGKVNEVGGNRSSGLIKRINEAGTGTLSIDELISKLQAEKERGGKTVRCTGTLLIPESGNKVIMSTEKQM